MRPSVRCRIQLFTALIFSHATSRDSSYSRPVLKGQNINVAQLIAATTNVKSSCCSALPIHARMFAVNVAEI